MTNTALEWAQWNVQQNPHLANLISIRDVKEVKYKPDIKLDEAIQAGPMPLSVDAFGNGVLSTELVEVKVSPDMNGCSKEAEKHGEEKNDDEMWWNIGAGADGSGSDSDFDGSA